MWSCVAEGTIPGVSKAPRAFILNGQAVQEEGTFDNQIIPCQLLKNLQTKVTKLVTWSEGLHNLYPSSIVTGDWEKRGWDGRDM